MHIDTLSKMIVFFEYHTYIVLVFTRFPLVPSLSQWAKSSPLGRNVGSRNILLGGHGEKPSSQCHKSRGF